tara:strand:+ start:50880 stop:51041 length:162 start_codon:yes stop_codon:yes gene_type:complete
VTKPRAINEVLFPNSARGHGRDAGVIDLIATTVSTGCGDILLARMIPAWGQDS